MKFILHFRILMLALVLTIAFNASAQQQDAGSEILTNDDVVLMAQAKLDTDIVVNKIKESKAAFDTSVKGLVDLKTAGVSEEIIRAMLEKNRALRDTVFTTTGAGGAMEKQTVVESVPTVIENPSDALRSAKTIAIEKSTVNPSRQALEKELLKRADWKRLNLNIVRYREGADLRVEIGFVPLSILTHRYVYRIYDNRSGTVIAAGETTSWGSLAENLARHIAKSLNKQLS